MSNVIEIDFINKNKESVIHCEHIITNECYDNSIFNDQLIHNVLQTILENNEIKNALNRKFNKIILSVYIIK